MIADIHEPLEQYAAQFKTAHLNHTADFFEDLVRQSGVDEEANARNVQQLRQLEQQAGGAGSINKWWRILRGVVIAATLCAGWYVYMHYSWPWLVVPAAIFAAAIYWLNRVINDSQQRLTALEQAREAKRAEAWGQMAPLNRLFDWDIIARLIQKTVPRIAFDPYFSNGRMEELRNSFRWSGELGNEHSIVFSHSGEINGNPFILARTLTHSMGSKTYHGSLAISWTEQVRGADGKWHTKTHHQTLKASVSQPFPQYENHTFIVYGNEAAPDLLFNRSPSDLSKLDDGFFTRIRKNSAIKKLEKKSRDLGEGNNFAVMSNREFDALFGATDRNHEVQFRLLFTPLAQQEVLKLLKDNDVGYGDDFTFSKTHMINIVRPAHMGQTDIGGEPEKFHAYELAHARDFFNRYHHEFFRSFYFGIAPLLAIPLYQQHRSHSDIYKAADGRKSCFWEHESIANYHGEAKFKHPDCVTRSILKTSSKMKDDGSQRVRVTASGYSRVERVTYVAVLGGDGRTHKVPVHWYEYHDVERASDPVVREQALSDDEGEVTMRKAFALRGVEYQHAIVRRSVASAMLPS